MDIPLFTSPFFRESYFLYPLWNSSRSKNCVLVVKKPHGFVAYSVTHRMRPSPPKKPQRNQRKIVYFNLALSHEGCDVPVIWWGRNLTISFLDKINLYFLYIFYNIFNIYVCVFCGKCGCICMISICMADNQPNTFLDWSRTYLMYFYMK